MKQKLYLVRHGQTEYNVQRRIQGWCDSPLTSLGILQAQQAGKFFEEKQIRFDHVYASDLKRAEDTARIICQDQIPVMLHAGLRERSWGSLDGTCIDDLLTSCPELDLDEGLGSFGAETVQACADRVLKTIWEIMAQPDHACVLMVTHSIGMNVLAHSLPAASHVYIPERMVNGAILELRLSGSLLLVQNFWQPE